MNDLQILLATILGALLVLLAAWMIAVRRDAARSKAEFYGFKFDLSNAGLVVLVVGCALLLMPAFVPYRPGGLAWPWREELVNKECEFRGGEAKAVVIDHPKSNASVPSRFPVSGSWKVIPEGHEIWIFTTADSGGSERYWPQEQAALRKEKMEWEGEVHGIGGDPGKKRSFSVFLVGPEGQKLVDFLKEINRTYVHFRRDLNTQYVESEATWVPLVKPCLASDIIKCDEKNVIVGQAN